MDNMKFYELSRKVPEEAQKQFNNGSFSGTDINPMWRIKKMTEMFGPCGVGWYYEIVSERAEEHHNMTMAIVDINLYIKVDGEWSKPIPGTGGNTLVKSTSKGQKASDEGYKMALTDALSVACKALGVGADIYFSKDKTKYTQYAKDEDGISPVGSAEAAQEAGKKKLEELNRKAEEAAKNSPSARQAATPEQIALIKDIASDEDYLKIMQKYGPDMEKLTANTAAKVIAELEKRNNSKIRRTNNSYEGGDIANMHRDMMADIDYYDEMH